MMHSVMPKGVEHVVISLFAIAMLLAVAVRVEAQERRPDPPSPPTAPPDRPPPSVPPKPLPTPQAPAKCTPQACMPASAPAYPVAYQQPCYQPVYYQQSCYQEQPCYPQHGYQGQRHCRLLSFLCRPRCFSFGCH